QVADGEQTIRPRRARSAEVRTDAEGRRARRARLQGHQPECAEAAAAGRAARDFFLLRRRVVRALPENPRRGRRGRGGIAASSRALSRGGGPPGAHRVSGGRVTEGAVAGTALGGCFRSMTL